MNLYRYVFNAPLAIIDPVGLKVCAPEFWESLIPVWGSGKAAIYDFQSGNWGKGLFNTAMAISDVFLVKAAVTGLAKGALKVGSHTWTATSKWLTKTGWREFKGQEMHHWAIPQGGWGRNIPDAIKNQPWNLMGTPSSEFHQALHRYGEMNALQRAWYGTPTWSKAGAFSTAGRGANIARGNDGCGCD